MGWYILLIVHVLAACNIALPQMTPTPEILISETPEPELTLPPTASLTPSLTPTEETSFVPVVIASPIPQITDQSVTEVTATSTPGACTVTVQEGDTLTSILLRESCGNQVNPGLIDAVVRANDNLVNADILPPPGSTLLIPNPTATAIPPGMDLTATAGAAIGVQIIGDQAFMQGQEFGCHTVERNETIIGIMELYDTTLEVLSQQNQPLNWLGCDFTNPSGGQNCNPTIREGQCINVPLPTRTPVPTATPSGNETATPTPTFEPVRTFFPPQGSIATGRVELAWVSAGILNSGEVYLIEIVDRTINQSYSFVTALQSYQLPDQIIPADGNPHQIEWRVSVARRNEDGTFVPVGGQGSWYGFTWNSR
jgi:hypothetical protein